MFEVCEMGWLVWNDVQHGNSCSIQKNVSGNSFSWSCCFLSCQLFDHRIHVLQAEIILKMADQGTLVWSNHIKGMGCWNWTKESIEEGIFQKENEPQGWLSGCCAFWCRIGLQFLQTTWRNYEQVRSKSWFLKSKTDTIQSTSDVHFQVKDPL